jgi:hypothetical protein
MPGQHLWVWTNFYQVRMTCMGDGAVAVELFEAVEEEAWKAKFSAALGPACKLVML